MTTHFCKLAIGLVVLVQLAIFGARPSWGDGSFFPPHNYGGEDLREPAQRALVVYRGGQESLFLFVDYQGDAKKFAWVVPCPAKPTMKLSSPAIWKEATQYYAHLQQVAWEKDRQRHNGGGGAVAPNREQEGVTVHSIALIGPYEVAILSANTGRGLSQWLKQNKYQMSPRARPILEQYVAEKWFFVAMKVRTPSQKLQSLPPIRLDFATSSPRYPLRISAINSGVADIRLYFVGALREETRKSTQGYFSQAFSIATDFSRLCPALQREFPHLDWQEMEMSRTQDFLVPQVMKRLDDHLSYDLALPYSSGSMPMTKGIAEAFMSPHRDEQDWAERNISYYGDGIPKDYYTVSGRPTKEHAAALRQIGKTGGKLLRDRLVAYILSKRTPEEDKSLEGAILLLGYCSIPTDSQVTKVIKFLESKSNIDAFHDHSIDALQGLGSPDSRRALNRIAQAHRELGAAFRFIYSLEDNPVGSDEKQIASRELLQLLSKGITEGDATTRAKVLLRQYTRQDFGDDWARWSRWLGQNKNHLPK